MNDGLHLTGPDHPAAVRRHHHRCLGRYAIADKRTLPGLREMHANALNTVDLRDAFRQFLLNRCTVARLFHELAGRHRGLVLERFEHAAVLTAWQSLRRQQNSRLVKTRGRHRQVAGRRIDARPEVCRLQVFKRSVLIDFRHTGKYCAVRRFLHPDINAAENDQCNQRHNSRECLTYRRLLQHIPQSCDPGQWRRCGSHGRIVRLRKCLSHGRARLGERRCSCVLRLGRYQCFRCTNRHLTSSASKN